MAKIYTVSQVNFYVKNVIDSDYVLSNLSVSGEISNLKYHSSGHVYFTLKDYGSAMNCVMFKTNVELLKFELSNGAKVTVNGYISVYEKTGSYQLYALAITKSGSGVLYEEFLKLKSKLEAEGLFDVSKKKPLPKYPERVAVVTAATGAALQDILQIARRRNKSIIIKIFPVTVQGNDAKYEISEAIGLLNKSKAADLIIVGRGGGSIEDLWAFNEEIVARSIFSSKIPIISAIGHETDVTIADFAADFRAPTPSAASEIAFFVTDDELEKINLYKKQIKNIVDNIFLYEKQRLNNAKKRLSISSPSAAIKYKKAAVAALKEKLITISRQSIITNKLELNNLIEVLDSLSPMSVLKRGYTLTYKEGKVIKSIDEINAGDNLEIHFKNGTANVKVNDLSEESNG